LVEYSYVTVARKRRPGVLTEKINELAGAEVVPPSGRVIDIRMLLEPHAGHAEAAGLHGAPHSPQSIFAVS
jgi:hypothetical protein